MCIRDSRYPMRPGLGLVPRGVNVWIMPDIRGAYCSVKRGGVLRAAVLPHRGDGFSCRAQPWTCFVRLSYSMRVALYLNCANSLVA
eukprot:1238099-Amphidinium_carterae.1